MLRSLHYFINSITTTMAAVSFQNVLRLSHKHHALKLLSPSPHNHRPSHSHSFFLRYFCSLHPNPTSLRVSESGSSSKTKCKSKSNKSRIMSYHSYIMPKPVHLKAGKRALITNSFGCGGEDSYFTTKWKEQLFIGVADGVGSWKPQKAKDAAKYAQELMQSGIQYISSLDEHDQNQNESVNVPQKMAHFAWHRVTDQMHFDGASTLCLLHIAEHQNNQCLLNAFNVGDSGFCIYRNLTESENGENDQNPKNPKKLKNAKNANFDGNQQLKESELSEGPCYGLFYKSPVQEQGFGIPYQLGSHPTANRVDDGECINRLVLQSHDLVILGSDGLWDNLWDHEIERIIGDAMKNYHRHYEEEQKEYGNHDKKGNALSFNNFVHREIVGGGLTLKLMKEAYLNSIDRKKSTPWSVTMTDTVDMVYNGGKPDDITCVVCFIH